MDRKWMENGDILQLGELNKAVSSDRQVEVRNATKGGNFTASHAL